MEYAVAALVAVGFVVGIYFLVHKADKANPKRPAGGRPKDPNIKTEER